MKRLSMMLACLAVTACDPAPQPAGDVEGTDGGEDAGTDSSADDGADDSGGPGNGGSIPSEPGVEWTVPLLNDQLIMHMEASTERVVVVQTGVFPVTHTTVVAYTPSMELDWQLEFDEASAGDLVALDDGSYLLVGAAGPVDSQIPGLWHLSCCGEVLQTETYAQPEGEQASATVVSPHAGGYWMAKFDFDGDSSLMRLDADFDLVDEPALVNRPHAMALGANGDVVMLSTDLATPWIQEVSIDGPGVAMNLQRPMGMIGSGAQLTLVAAELDQVVLQPYGEIDATAFAVPQLPFAEAEYGASRGNRVVITNSITNNADGPSVQLTEADDAGNIHRRLFIDANAGQDFIHATVSAVSEDDAIYVVTQQSALGETLMADLHRIPAI